MDLHRQDMLKAALAETLYVTDLNGEVCSIHRGDVRKVVFSSPQDGKVETIILLKGGSAADKFGLHLVVQESQAQIEGILRGVPTLTMKKAWKEELKSILQNNELSDMRDIIRRVFQEKENDLYAERNKKLEDLESVLRSAQRTINDIELRNEKRGTAKHIGAFLIGKKSDEAREIDGLQRKIHEIQSEGKKLRNDYDLRLNEFRMHRDSAFENLDGRVAESLSDFSLDPQVEIIAAVFEFNMQNWGTDPSTPSESDDDEFSTRHHDRKMSRSIGDAVLEVKAPEDMRSLYKELFEEVARRKAKNNEEFRLPNLTFEFQRLIDRDYARERRHERSQGRGFSR